MASAKPGVHIVQLKPVSIPRYMIEGDKWVKWEEETNTLEPITLKVDENGFFLYWTGPKDTETLDISIIRDTRTGSSARLPKDVKLRSQINYGSKEDLLEDKTMTVVSGPDFVNLSFTTFTTEKKEVARQWTTTLLSLSTNLLQLNSPVISFLLKIHTKIMLSADKMGRILVKSIVKTFTTHKEDKKRVEKALGEALGGVREWGKTDTIDSTTFNFNVFFTFYTNLTSRSEVRQVFNRFSKKDVMTAEEFMDFINKEQRDPRLNEILYPYASEERARELIETYKPPESTTPGLTFLGFLRYILSEDNAVVSYEKYDLSDDMDQPLCHYFINSSHNTYLTGHQLTGKSSVEMYRQTLVAGCRCVELDFWNGPREEPVIVHGYTLVPDISAKDVIEAIAESAFKTSDYPVILSFENHCNPKQQAKIAAYCREFFGDFLLDGVLEGFPLEPGAPLPPPSMLKNKIIIKNKKKHHHHHQKKKKPLKSTAHSSPLLSSQLVSSSQDPDPSSDSDSDASSSSSSSSSSSNSSTSSSTPKDKPIAPPVVLPTDKGTAGKESEAGAEISALVNYVQPVHFYSFEGSLARNKSYEMSSFDERQAMTLLKERPVEFVNYNKHQLSRVYPRGTRVDSANFMPQLFWNAGCQLVALNYQTLDLAMQLNMGIFELNRKCGYLLKPEFMRRRDRQFDPFAESTVDGIIAGSVIIKIISAQLLSPRSRTPTYVEAEMYGLPTDTIRKKFRTKIVQNSLNPIYEEEVFLFKKIVLPELAVIRIVVCEDNGKVLGHRVLPVKGLRPGYRHIVLRNESGQPTVGSCVFVHITVKDYVPEGWMGDFAEALANPIKYQNELEKRSRQLDVLCIGEEEREEEEETTPILFDAPEASISLPTPATPAKPWNVSIKKKPSTDSTTTINNKDPDPSASPSPSLTLCNPPPPPPLAAYGKSGSSKIVHFYVETFEFYLGNKGVREKMTNLSKKLEEVRKKPKKILIKKMSRVDLTEGGDERERVERVEREVVERGMEELTRLLSKTITETHSKQLKLLSTLKERSSNEIMKWIYAWRKDEYRRLSKLTRDRNELGRMKREVNNVLVAKGVSEREKIDTTFFEIEGKLMKDHLIVVKELEKWGMERPPTFLQQGQQSAGGSVGGIQLLKFTRN